MGYLASEKDASAAKSGVSAARVAARAASCLEERIMKYLAGAPDVKSARPVTSEGNALLMSGSVRQFSCEATLSSQRIRGPVDPEHGHGWGPRAVVAGASARRDD